MNDRSPIFTVENFFAFALATTLFASLLLIASEMVGR
jgi:hypothetical protein